jgi:hypothetical protein
MLVNNQLSGFGAGGVNKIYPPKRVYSGYIDTISSVNSTTGVAYTFTDIPIGNPSPNRRVAIAIQGISYYGFSQYDIAILALPANSDTYTGNYNFGFIQYGFDTPSYTNLSTAILSFRMPTEITKTDIAIKLYDDATKDFIYDTNYAFLGASIDVWNYEGKSTALTTKDFALYGSHSPTIPSLYDKNLNVNDDGIVLSAAYTKGTQTANWNGSLDDYVNNTYTFGGKTTTLSSGYKIPTEKQNDYPVDPNWTGTVTDNQAVSIFIS